MSAALALDAVAETRAGPENRQPLRLWTTRSARLESAASRPCTAASPA
jgi:hypothetical protein